MKRALKGAGVILLVLVVVGLIAALWLLFFQGRAPAPRPDLVRLPEQAPPNVPGYPTQNALMAAYALGWLDVFTNLHIPVPADVELRENVEYGKVGDRPLLLDVYLPKNRTANRVPGLIFIHGGGWSSGDKRDYRVYTIDFARAGYVAASISYRFQQEAKFPAAVQDAKCAVRWLRAHADELGVDPEKIVAIGGSAGGYLAMMLGYTANIPELEGEGGYAGVSSAVAAVVDFYGPTDFTVPFAHNHPTVVNFLGKTYGEDPELYHFASPLHHVKAGAPPTLIFHGTLDTIVPVEQADALAEKLKTLGVPYWYDRVDGYPHTMDIVKPINQRCQTLLRGFLRTYVENDHQQRACRNMTGRRANLFPFQEYALFDDLTREAKEVYTYHRFPKLLRHEVRF